MSEQLQLVLLAKSCLGCGVEKPLELFPTHKRMKDGRHPRCRECNNAARREARANDPEMRRRQLQKTREWKLAHPERVRELNRVSDRKRYWDDPEAGRAKKLAQYRANPEAWRARHNAKPIVQHRAWWRIHELKRSGRLEYPEACPKCGRGDLRIEAHHPDHNKPEDVVFLCSKCHGETRRIQ